MAQATQHTINQINMNRLRGEYVIVDLAEVKEDTKDSFEQRESGIFVGKDETRPAHLTKGRVVLVGTKIHPQDIKVGDTVYVKRTQGEKLSPDSEEFLFPERAIIGND